MKLILLSLFVAFTCQAQTYVNYKMTNFVYTNDTLPTITVDVPANTLLKIHDIRSSRYTLSRAYLECPESTNQIMVAEFYNGSSHIDGPILGPAKIHLTGYGSNEKQDICLMLASFQTVNTAPALQGYGVQPNGKSAKVTLETSADLNTWSVTTNGTYPATNQAAFYRIGLEIN